MKTLIIYKSIHHENTKKVAERMASVLETKLAGPNDFNPVEISNHDLIGFGSGIYGAKHHKDLFDLVHNFPDFNGKKAFIFSTSGGGEKDIEKSHKKLREKLKEKKFDIIGEFNCKGWVGLGPLKLIGGMNKGRPSEEDLKNVESFARELKKKIVLS